MKTLFVCSRCVFAPFLKLFFFTDSPPSNVRRSSSPSPAFTSSSCIACISYTFELFSFVSPRPTRSANNYATSTDTENFPPFIERIISFYLALLSFYFSFLLFCFSFSVFPSPGAHSLYRHAKLFFSVRSLIGTKEENMKFK